MALSEAALVEAIISAGLLDEDQVAALRRKAKIDRVKLRDAIMRNQRFPLSAFYQAYAETNQLAFIQPGKIEPDLSLVTKLPASLITRRQVLPVKLKGEIFLATADPNDQVGLESVNKALNQDYLAAVSEPDALEAAINDALGQEKAGDGKIDSVALFDEVMQEAYLQRASDIHIEPLENYTRVRFRVDGHLQAYKRRMTEEETLVLVNRIKVLGGMDIAETREPQDGGMAYKILDWNMGGIDLRVATIPVSWGERVTMRILGAGDDGIPLDKLGMPDEILAEFREALNHPHGMILVTGPTGSGKSTTLYGALREKNSGDENIMTAEDPVEQEIPGVSQVKCGSKVTFAAALRSFLRHDPDIILVGEIRDLETADTGMKAAMTGHLVLSTLHTNDALSAVTRLVDIGVDRFMVSDTLVGIMAQRLVRRLCPSCRKPIAVSDEQAKVLDVPVGTEIFEPNGCAACIGKGYAGRVGLYEALWVNEDLADAISSAKQKDELRAAATAIRPLWDDARAKVLNGGTSYEEVKNFRHGAT